MKILIIGLGSIAKKHIHAIWENLPNAQIYAFRSSMNGADCEGVKNLYDWQEVYRISFDFIIISNPTSKHREVIEKLKGCHIPLFIEKPLFESLEGEQLVNSLKENGTPTYVACNLRFLDVIRFLKQNLVMETVNEVNVYCGSYLPDWRPGIDFRKCYSANPELGGGVHIDLIHEIDYIYWLFGNPLKVHKVFTNKSTLNIRAYDYANYILEYKSFNVNIVLNYYRRDSKRTCEVVTSEGTYLVDLLNGKIFNEKGVVIQSYTQRISDTYNAQMNKFMAMLKMNRFDFNTAEDGYNVLKICLE